MQSRVRTPVGSLREWITLVGRKTNPRRRLFERETKDIEAYANNEPRAVDNLRLSRGRDIHEVE